jgi:hypothetical protein
VLPKASPALLPPAFLRALLPWLLVALSMTVATYSVVRYEFRIVAVYVVAAVLLAAWLLRARAVPSRHPPTTVPAPAASRDDGLGGVGGGLGGGLVPAVALVAVAVLHLLVRPYTYLSTAEGWTVRGVFAATALATAVALVVAGRPGSRRGGWLPVLVAGTGFAVASVLLIVGDPRPKIDVWVMLQQTADGLLDGQNMYSQNWHDSPGVQDSFTYLPLMGLLLAPGRWLAGDVRWTLVLITLAGALCVALLGGRRPGPVAGGAAALLLLMPGTPTQVEQAWTEPLLMTCLAAWALAVVRGRWAFAVLALAVGLACKQHLVLLLPILALWPRFGWRRTAASALLAGAFMLPWFLTAPADFLHDTVSVLVHFQPLIFADTLYIAAINDLGWTPPFWLTGAAVLATVAAAAALVRRRDPDPATVLRWTALVLLVANLVNKQAFYNQYWLVAALVVISFAVPAPTAPVSPAEPDPRPAGAAA